MTPKYSFIFYAALVIHIQFADGEAKASRVVLPIFGQRKHAFDKGFSRFLLFHSGEPQSFVAVIAAAKRHFVFRK